MIEPTETIIEYKGQDIIVDAGPMTPLLVHMKNYGEGHYLRCWSMAEARQTIDRFNSTGCWFLIH